MKRLYDKNGTYKRPRGARREMESRPSDNWVVRGGPVPPEGSARHELTVATERQPPCGQILGFFHKSR